MKRSKLDEIILVLDGAGNYVGKISSIDLEKLFNLFKDKKISLRPNNPATAQLIGNVCFGAVFGGAIGYLFTNSASVAACIAAMGASFSYLFTTYSITVTPTGERDSKGIPLWEFSIVAN